MDDNDGDEKKLGTDIIPLSFISLNHYKIPLRQTFNIGRTEAQGN